MCNLETGLQSPRRAFGERSSALLDTALEMLSDITAAISLNGAHPSMEVRATIALELDGARDDAERLVLAARWVDTLQREIARRQELSADEQQRPRWQVQLGRLASRLEFRAAEMAEVARNWLARWLPVATAAVMGLIAVAAYYEATDPGSVLRWSLGLVSGARHIASAVYVGPAEAASFCAAAAE